MSEYSRFQRNAWIEVDLSAIRANYQQVEALKSPGVRCMAVVKADGYGLGAVAMARTLVQAGCDAFAVTTVQQGAALRRAGIPGLILVVAPTQKEEWNEALERNLTLSISQVADLEALEEFCARLHQSIDIHLEIETGMGRTGLFPEDLCEAVPVLLSLQYVKTVGVYTHFAQAESKKGKKYTQMQFMVFHEAVEVLQMNGINTGLRHVCNSPAFLAFPEYHLDMIRIGTLLIGQLPAPHLGMGMKLSEPWRAKARVLQVRRMPANKHISYHGLYVTRSETQLALIGLGYADGFGVEPRFTPRGFIDLIKIIIKNIGIFLGIQLGSSAGCISINGRQVRIAGKVGMELTVLDVGQAECKVGQEVIVPLRRTAASVRLKRVYIDKKQTEFKRRVEDIWEETDAKTQPG